MTDSRRIEDKLLAQDFDGVLVSLFIDPAHEKETQKNDPLLKYINFWHIMAERNRGLSSEFAANRRSRDKYLTAQFASDQAYLSPFYLYLNHLPVSAGFRSVNSNTATKIIGAIIGFIPSVLSLIEGIPAVVGALFSSLHAEVVLKRRASKFIGKIGWGLASAFTSMLDMVVAQPLFLISNVIKNIKGAVDGAFNVVGGLFSLSLDRFKAGMKGVVGSAARLVCNAITLGIAAGALYFAAPVMIGVAVGSGAAFSSASMMASAVVSPVTGLGALVLGVLRTFSAKTGFTGYINSFFVKSSKPSSGDITTRGTNSASEIEQRSASPSVVDSVVDNDEQNKALDKLEEKDQPARPRFGSKVLNSTATVVFDLGDAERYVQPSGGLSKSLTENSSSEQKSLETDPNSPTSSLSFASVASGGNPVSSEQHTSDNDTHLKPGQVVVSSAPNTPESAVAQQDKETRAGSPSLGRRV